MKNKPIKICGPRGASFINGTHLKLDLLKKVVDQKTLAPIKVCFAGRDYMMCENFGNYWVEYRDPVDLMDRPSNMDISLWWYKRGQQQVTYDLTNQLMRNFL